MSTRHVGDWPPVVLIGLDSLQGLQTARIFRARGVSVIAIASDATHPACRTNACTDILIAPTSGTELVDELLRMAEYGLNGAVLVPCQDRSVRTVAEAASTLARHYDFVLPPVDVVEMMMDKVQFVEHAARNGLPIPQTFVLRGMDDARRAASELGFPSVLKPSSRSAEWDEYTKKKVFKIESAEELLAKYETTRDWAEVMVVQQFVEGDDTHLYSCNCYFSAASGEPLVTFTARKLRQWPPEAGTSCLGEEVRDEVVLETALSLFGSVPYQGLAYLEMKKDARTGEYFIIEPNVGRPTGRSAIAEAGGVELLFTMYCDAAGLPLPENRTQTYSGTKWIDLRHDAQSALYYWRRGRLSLREWLASWRGRKAHAVFSVRDPLPFVFDVVKTTGLVVTVARKNLGERRADEPTTS